MRFDYVSFILFLFLPQFGRCIRTCSFNGRGDTQLGAIYTEPQSGREICVHLRGRESRDQSMSRYYGNDQEGVARAGLAAMAMNGVNAARIDPDTVLRFDPLNGITRTRLNIQNALNRIVYTNEYDETIEGGFLAFKTNYDELRRGDPYTVEREGYCSIEDMNGGKRAKLCYRIDAANCVRPYRPKEAKSVGYVFQFASWYKATYGKDLVLKLSYGDDHDRYKNGQIVGERAAFLIFNKTTVRVEENYAIYDYAHSTIVYGLPNWALIDLAQPPSVSWSVGDPVLSANPNPPPVIPIMCFLAYKVTTPAAENPSPTPEEPTTKTSTAKLATTTTTTKLPSLTPLLTGTRIDKNVPYSRTRIESRHNQLLKDGNGDAPDKDVDLSTIIPGIENRFLYFVVGFMGVLLVAMCTGMIVHYELKHNRVK